MSDDEDIVYVKKQKTIHYGSLETTMEDRMKQIRSEAESLPAVNSNNSSAALIPEYFDIDLEM
jgi:hypothetical protein